MTAARQNIDYQCFEDLIRRLRAAGLSETAERLDDLLRRWSWTTGSELLGELGLAILAFQNAAPAEAANLHSEIERCLEMVRRVWPEIKGRD